MPVIDKEFICHQFAGVLRDLIRAVAMRDDPSPAVRRAAEQWESLVNLVSDSQERISPYDMFSAGVAIMREVEDESVTEGEVDHALLIAARLGMAFYIELSSDDNPSEARISQRKSAFVSAIERIEHAKNDRRERRGGAT